jgi:DNA primase
VIPEEKIAEIRESAKISEFVSAHVTLKRRGRSLLGLCPFHNEKTPSFSVNDEHGFFHCFGCSAGGNIFKFLMMMENLTFPEAVRKVAERYGIRVEDDGDRSADARATLFEVNASAARYFRRCLLETPPGKDALAYLGRRGIGDQASDAFQIGVAPSSGDGLVRWLRREGGEIEHAIKVGLIGNRGGRTYDRFRGRLMFPIRDAQGRVIGFGGRLIADGDGPKYLNSPESEVYRKSRALYGVYESRDALRDSELLLLVEGYLDVIALHQAGIKTTVATCGTALTAEQARIMRRYAADVVTLFDGDAAGGSAAARSFPIFIEAGLWARGAELPAGEDPDSFVRSHGREALERRIEQAVPLAEAYVRHVVDTAAGGDIGMARAGAELAALLGKVDDPFARDLLVRKASLWTGLSEDVLRRQGRKTAPPAPGRPAPPRRSRAASGPEELLVTLALVDRECALRADRSGALDEMADPVWKALADGIISLIRKGKTIDVGEILDELPDEPKSRVRTKLLEGDFGDSEVRGRIVDDCVRKIQEATRRRHNAAMLAELRKREQLGIDLQPDEELAGWKPRNPSDA